MDEGDLRTLLDEHARRHSVPGAAVGLLRDGMVTTAQFGVADVRTSEPFTPDSLFGLGSLTKSMVATAIVRLDGDGRLSLDESVVAHLPELRNSRWAREATVRDLLANRAGPPLSTRSEFDFDHLGSGADGLSRLVAEVGAAGHRSHVWSYTNVGWCLLGRIIETVTGSSWETAMSEHLGDLGLTSTLFAPVAGAGPARVAGHEVKADGPMPVAPLASPAYAPAGTLAVSTVTDLLRLASAHLEDSTLAGLRDTHAEVPIHGWLDAWCLGWARFDWAGGPVWGWDGLIPGERSILRLVPHRRAAIALATNSSTGRSMYRSLFAHLMPSLWGIEVPTLALDPLPGAAGDLARFAGVYAWPDRRLTVEVSNNAFGGGLRITSDRGVRDVLSVAERTFLVDASDPDFPTITFGADGVDGEPEVLYETLWGLPRLVAPGPVGSDHVKGPGRG